MPIVVSYVNVVACELPREAPASGERCSVCGAEPDAVHHLVVRNVSGPPSPRAIAVCDDCMARLEPLQQSA